MNARGVTAGLVSVLLTLATEQGYAATWNVPGDFATVQAAIDASVAGDTVLVGPGVWTGETRFSQLCANFLPTHSVALLKTDVSLISTAGPASTVLDGGPIAGTAVSTVLLAGGSAGVCRVEGFTITGGQQGVEAGCTGTELELVNCWIDGNGGNAVSMSQASISLIDCRVTNSQDVTTNIDGGVYGDQGSSLIATRTVFEGNATGGVVMVDSPGVIIDQCEFSENMRRALGLANCADFQVTRSLFVGNRTVGSSQHGGALAVSDTFNGLVEFCTFVGDSALVGQGGGVYLRDSSGIVVENNTFYRCFASSIGGAVMIGSSSSAVTVRNNVVVECSEGALAMAPGANVEGSGCNVLWENFTDYMFWDDSAKLTDVVADPLLCDPQAGEFTVDQLSPAAEVNAGLCGAIGAHGVGCGTIHIEPATWARIKGQFRSSEKE